MSAEQRPSIGDYVVVIGTGGFTNVNDGEIHDVGGNVKPWFHRR